MRVVPGSRKDLGHMNTGSSGQASELKPDIQRPRPLPAGENLPPESFPHTDIHPDSISTLMLLCSLGSPAPEQMCLIAAELRILQACALLGTPSGFEVGVGALRQGPCKKSMGNSCFCVGEVGESS